MLDGCGFVRSPDRSFRPGCTAHRTFYVLSTSDHDRQVPTQRTTRLGPLKALRPRQCKYDELKAAIHEAAAVNRWIGALLPHAFDLDNRTVVGFATKTGKTAPPSRAEKARRLSSRRCRFAIEKRNLQLCRDATKIDKPHFVVKQALTREVGSSLGFPC